MKAVYEFMAALRAQMAPPDQTLPSSLLKRNQELRAFIKGKKNIKESKIRYCIT